MIWPSLMNVGPSVRRRGAAESSARPTIRAPCLSGAPTATASQRAKARPRQRRATPRRQPLGVVSAGTAANSVPSRSSPHQTDLAAVKPHGASSENAPNEVAASRHVVHHGRGPRSSPDRSPPARPWSSPSITVAPTEAPLDLAPAVKTSGRTVAYKCIVAATSCRRVPRHPRHDDRQRGPSHDRRGAADRGGRVGRHRLHAVLAMWIPASGWIGDRFGTKRAFLIALVLFVAVRSLCGIAQSIGQLIAFRVLQGIGGGMLTPVGMAMMFRRSPGRAGPGGDIMIVPTSPRRPSGRSSAACSPHHRGAGSSWSTCRSASSPWSSALRFLREHPEPDAATSTSPGSCSPASVWPRSPTRSPKARSGWDDPDHRRCSASPASSPSRLRRVETQRSRCSPCACSATGCSRTTNIVMGVGSRASSACCSSSRCTSRVFAASTVRVRPDDVPAGHRRHHLLSSPAASRTESAHAK